LYLFAFNINSFSNALSLSLFQREVAMSSAVRCRPLCNSYRKRVTVSNVSSLMLISLSGALQPSACVKIWLAHDKLFAANALSLLNVGLKVTVENVFLELC